MKLFVDIWFSVYRTAIFDDEYVSIGGTISLFLAYSSIVLTMITTDRIFLINAIWFMILHIYTQYKVNINIPKEIEE